MQAMFRKHLLGYLLSSALLLLPPLAGCEAAAPTSTLTVTAAATATTPATATDAATAVSTPGPAEQLVPKVLSVRPHDTNAFTEGLLWHNGLLYESSGLYGASNIRKVDPTTGQVLLRKDDPPQVFGEGLALYGNRLYQLTWKEHIGYIYDVDTFAQVGTFTYDGEGWGLCFDGQHFVMSNGSAALTTRDAKTFAVVTSTQVTLNGTPVNMLNELECVGDAVYANVWMTDNILRIDKATGKVTAVIDASGLLTPQERAAAGTDGVLNGIAYDTVHNTFMITGKLWPKLFEVKFVPKGGG
jgi:glutaminyl-peptide cyclotransferase